MKLPSRRVLLARVLYGLGVVHLAGLFGRWFGQRPPLYLTGHRVVPAPGVDAVDRMALLSGHAITPEELDRRLAFLQRWVMPAGDPADLRAGNPPPGRFYLTFDDGYLDNLLHAAPVLVRRKVQAVIFIVADLVHQPRAQPWWDRWGAEALEASDDEGRASLAYNERCGRAKAVFRGLDANDLQPSPARRYLDLGELAALGAPFYVANHTRSHANLTLLDDAELSCHLQQGDAVIATHPRRLPLLAYPFGVRSERVLRHVQQQATATMAFATGRGVDGDPYQMRRLNLNVSDFPLLAAEAVGLLR